MYACNYCDAEVKTRQGLSGHIRFRHQGVGYQGNRRSEPASRPSPNKATNPKDLRSQSEPTEPPSQVPPWLEERLSILEEESHLTSSLLWEIARCTPGFRLEVRDREAVRIEMLIRRRKEMRASFGTTQR